jgi:leucyl aminopeptidase
MFEIKNSLKDIKKSNFVYFIKEKKDLAHLDFLSLDKKIIKKIEESLKWKKSEKLHFFLWDKNFENLIVLIHKEDKKLSLVDFISKEMKVLPKNFTLCSQDDKNLSLLLKSCLLSRYNFDQYKTEKNTDEIYFFCDKRDNIELESTYNLVQNIILARDLWETPASDLTPEAFAKLVKKTKFKNTKIKILSPKQIEKQWLGLLWWVGKASTAKPYLVILERIIDKKLPTVGIVWKWVTFDTGWIQVKPGDHMYEMKGDMCWAATVFATMKEIDNKDLNVNIVAALWLAENWISGEWYKPSDILTAYNGKTVDIIHTDAEWRLVMADTMSYISDKYNLDSLMTVATLTWACMMALWFRYAGVMWDNEDMIEKLLDHSKNNEEKYCRLPYDQYFIDKTKSEIADLENLNRWVYAWSSMWAAFLANFLDNDEKYTHLDIAGTALNSYEPYGYVNKGMTGFWVESLSDVLQQLK